MEAKKTYLQVMRRIKPKSAIASRSSFIVDQAEIFLSRKASIKVIVVEATVVFLC